MEPLKPSEGLGVLHLFCKSSEQIKTDLLIEVVDGISSQGGQVIPVSILGHKADLAFMVLSEDWVSLREFQTGITNCGLQIVDSYVSLTEISEYATGVPDEMRNARLYPELPPEGKTAWCFYPMSKRRNVDQNWFTLDFEKRKNLMYEHGASGRKFAGRVLQVITGSTGIDDFEWGVTLFCEKPDDLKDVVYTMRFDEASAEYAEFGPFYAGIVGEMHQVLEVIS
ncbi:MAG: chlorite dismutase family protein [Acidimicrobiales bacterium]|jgi:chlorite dismutase|nr:chlorite dismutase family protein [Acidimicrobiales bacterium]MDP6298873.1 chlorite dismutase family protein [Acidimicrobiales bacterium]HJM28660.1 chlorite dismutase family protein [Acidimicrobiales bacterium]HJM97944.1 chlorite dismutase family protein [Acidimicrobiales bacterium]